MNKKTFLEKLKKSLSILKDEERDDILNEYKDIIEEKVKHGLTEEEAVKEFGEYKTLVDGILDAYKINAQENKESAVKDKAKEFLNSGEELIKEGAKKLTEATDKLVTDIKENNNDITLEFIFEIILRGLCFLVIIALLSIPFTIFAKLGQGFLDFAFFPLNHILPFIWVLLIGVLYLVAIGIGFIAMFKGYLKKNQTPSKVQQKKTTKKSHPKETKKETEKEEEKEEDKSKDKEKEETEVSYKNQDYKYEYKKEKVVTTTASDTIGNLFIILAKMFIIILFIIPIWCVIIGLAVALAFVIFLLCKGIGVIGIALAIVGGMIFLIQFSSLVYNGLFTQQRCRFSPFIVSLVFIVAGGLLTVDYFINIDYIDRIDPSSQMEVETKKLDYTITAPTKIYASDDEYKMNVDPTLENGKVVVEISYYNEYLDPNLETYQHNDRLYFGLDFNTKETFRFVLDNLKKNKIYDMDVLDTLYITITCNEQTKNLITTD